jgi:transposase
MARRSPVPELLCSSSRSSKGTIEQPGKQVAQKSGLNRAILDQGCGEFRRQLDYKVMWNGGMLLAVPPHHTSRTCPCCDHVSKDNRQTQAKFLCVECGYENHADVVGAINVRAGILLVSLWSALIRPLDEAWAHAPTPPKRLRKLPRSAVGISFL